MQNPNEIPGLNELVDAIAARLSGRVQFGPGGEALPQLPPGWEPPAQLDDPWRNFRAGASLGIDGLEFTQSTQYVGTSGPSYGRENAVPLVAYKMMVVRAYPFVRRGILGDAALTGQRVTGELTLSVGSRAIFRTGPTRAARGAPRFSLADRSQSVGSRDHVSWWRAGSGAPGTRYCKQPAQLYGPGLLLQARKDPRLCAVVAGRRWRHVGQVRQRDRVPPVPGCTRPKSLPRPGKLGRCCRQCQPAHRPGNA